ncbi:MAG: hypothetical protein WDO13_17455 [Verrucomicrobiota bacterium]
MAILAAALAGCGKSGDSGPAAKPASDTVKIGPGRRADRRRRPDRREHAQRLADRHRRVEREGRRARQED